MGSFQTSFSLNFGEEIKSTDVNKKEISAPVTASTRGPTILEGVERFNVSASWKKFSRLGRLGRPIVPGDTVVTCHGGSSDTDTDTGVGIADNILYVKGIRSCQWSIEDYFQNLKGL